MSDFGICGYAFFVVNIVCFAVCSLHFKKSILCANFSPPFGSRISPRYLKCATLVILPYLVFNFWMFNLVQKNFVFWKEICRPTFSSHSLRTSIYLIAVVSLSERMATSSAKARHDISILSLGRPSHIGFQ